MRNLVLLAVSLLLVGSCKKKKEEPGKFWSEGTNRQKCLTDCYEAGINPIYLYYYDSTTLDTILFNTYKEGDSFKASSLLKSEVLYEEKMEASKIWMHRGNDFEIIVNHIDTFRISKITSIPTKEWVICNYEPCFYYPTYIEINGEPGELKGYPYGRAAVYLKNPVH